MSMTEKLAYIKKLRHLTTEEIARHSGVPVGTLNKIFSGQTRHPTAEPMARLAQSLRVPIRYLLDDALPLECYISLNGSDGPILLSDEEIRLLMRLRELEPRSRRAMGIMAELLGAPAPCLAGGIATRHLYCFLPAATEAENPPWGALRPRPVLTPEPAAAAREADFAVLLPDGSLEPLYSAGAVLLCRRENALPARDMPSFFSTAHLFSAAFTGATASPNWWPPMWTSRPSPSGTGTAWSISARLPARPRTAGGNSGRTVSSPPPSSLFIY